MRPLDLTDFRALRYMLDADDFGYAPGKYPGPTNLIDEDTWKSIVNLPDDVSIRTSDRYGKQIRILWDFWGLWTSLILSVQSHTKDPNSPTAIAVADATDEFQAATYCALVGYYRAAFSCLRNVLEQVTIACQLTLGKDIQAFNEWKNGEEKIKFGWAADRLPSNPCVAKLEEALLKSNCNDTLFGQNPKGYVRRLFLQLSKYTHGVAGFADGHLRESNGPIFLPKVFLDWSVLSLKTQAVALHELKLTHPRLKKLQYEQPTKTLDDFRSSVVAQIPRGDSDKAILESLVAFLN